MADDCTLTPGCQRGRHAPEAYPCGGPFHTPGDPCQFCGKLCEEVANGNVSEALVLVNNATETVWFQRMPEVAKAICWRVLARDPLAAFGLRQQTCSGLRPSPIPY